MTPRQIYVALSHIASYTCSDGEIFLRSKRATKSDVAYVQGEIRALLDKINHSRRIIDFPRGNQLPTRRARSAPTVAVTRHPPTDAAFIAEIFERRVLGGQ